MGPWEALILGVVQGLAEFLPVSSSGHLVLAQHLLGMREPELLFDVAVHAGTLLAVLVVFKAAIFEAVGGFFWFLARAGRREPVVWDAGARVAGLVILGSVPTAILGLSVEHWMEWAFASLPLVCAMLTVTGAVLWLTRRAPAGGADASGLTVRQGLIMGVVQGLAAIPGISRSGTTIA
ncbi:MAG: undecaprenyl-diphosphate phosphatase, partial [Pseudomonadota bacterium]